MKETMVIPDKLMVYTSFIDRNAFTFIMVIPDKLMVYTSTYKRRHKMVIPYK